MTDEQKLISKAISPKELSEIKKIINNNKIIKDDQDACLEYREWYSSEGDSFQVSKTVDNTEYLFEIKSDGEIHLLGRLDDLMADENLQIELTDDCEKSFYGFSQKEQDEIINKFEYYGELFINNRPEFFQHAHQPIFFKLNDKFDSSLYYFVINKEIRAIASVDEDPIFDSVTITLFNVFKNEDIENNFKHAANSYYQQFSNVKQV